MRRLQSLEKDLFHPQQVLIDRWNIFFMFLLSVEEIIDRWLQFVFYKNGARMVAKG